MARPLVPDTTVWLSAIRDPMAWPAFQQDLASGLLWLSSVVIAGLYAGTRSREDGRLIDRIVAAMARVQRILAPTPEEWARAGRLISRRVRLCGDLRPRDHLADVLILVSAARLAGAVSTSNVRHFKSWAALARGSDLDVVIVPFQQPSHQ